VTVRQISNSLFLFPCYFLLFKLCLVKEKFVNLLFTNDLFSAKEEGESVKALVHADVEDFAP